MERESLASPVKVRVLAAPARRNPDEDVCSKAPRAGRSANEVARAALESACFTDIEKNQRQAGGIEDSFFARDGRGRLWFFDVAGGFHNHRGGLTRSDVLWTALGEAIVLNEAGTTPLVLLANALPARGAGADILKLVTGCTSRSTRP